MPSTIDRSAKKGRCGLMRSLAYVKGEPAMILAPIVPREKKRAYVICLSAAWQYREPAYMLNQCMLITDIFGLGLHSSQFLAQIASFIEDGLDDLVMMPPPEEPAKIIGEGTMSIDGYKPTSFEITDGVFDAA